MRAFILASETLSINKFAAEHEQFGRQGIIPSMFSTARMPSLAQIESTKEKFELKDYDTLQTPIPKTL